MTSVTSVSPPQKMAKNPITTARQVGERPRQPRLRRRAGAGGLNVVCCDNLPHNGRVLEGLVATFAAARSQELADWIGAHAAFPCTMVDRIVPATTDADLADVAARLGVRDAAPVVAEPWIQWVIEDRFVVGRPAWEEAGAEIAADVAPYETMKLRLLNGSHSTLAYLGFLAGHATIAQAALDPLLGRLGKILEITPYKLETNCCWGSAPDPTN